MKLISLFHHLLVPHPGNNHRPHAIRPIALLIVVLTVGAQQFFPWIAISHHQGNVLAYATDINPVELLKDTNAERVKAGVPPLRLEARLNASASDKSNDMFKYDYWAHVSPSGVQPWHWFEAEHYAYSYAGENLAKDFDTSAGVTQGWMNSPTHRDNLLNIHYSDVGFSVQNGTLQGSPMTLVVAHYGTVAQAAIAAASTTPVASATPGPIVKSTPTPVPVVAAAVPTPSVNPTSAPTPVATTVTTFARVENAPVQYKKYSLFDPLSVSKTLTSGSEISLSFLLIILGIMIMSHLTVWRRRIIHGLTHRYKLRASTEMAIIGAGIVIIIVRSFGSVT